MGAAALTGLNYYNKLFAWEYRFKNISTKEQTEQRLEEEKPILDALLVQADSVFAAPKSARGKALHYLKAQRPYLLRYLEDGRLELSVNRAERSIKPFVIVRKNFLFANPPAEHLGQRGDLQPDRDGQGNRTGAVPLFDLGFEKFSGVGSDRGGLGGIAAPGKCTKGLPFEMILRNQATMLKLSIVALLVVIGI